MRRALFTTLLAVAPRAVLACPVCFGQNDSPLALGINYGILAMLGFIGSLLLAFASFFIYLMRRAHLADEPSTGLRPSVEASAAVAGVSHAAHPEFGGQVPHPQEGTI